MVEMQAIKTKYNGVVFRSKLEAQWAKFFDAHNIEWQYEVEGYDLGNGLWYLPDFYLPKQDCFFEVKGVFAEKDKEKIEQLSIKSEKEVFIGYGNGVIDECCGLGWKKFDNEVTLEKCPKCGEYFFSDTAGFHGCRVCGFYGGNDCCKTVYCHENNYRISCDSETETSSYWREHATIDIREGCV